MTVFYTVGRAITRFVHLNCIRFTVVHRERFDLPGGFVLASSHLSHLEPFMVGGVVRRKIDWMSRIEFYRHRPVAIALHLLDAFPVNRQGVPVKAIRTAIDRVRRGRIVGIFPEGGVVNGPESVLRGGPIKKGACVIAQRSGAPVLPVVVVGTDRLNHVRPWLPFRRARVWVIFGQPVYPRYDLGGRRSVRDWMAAQLQREFESMYQELCRQWGVDDREVA
jgi:1-acyl-sn-glycerol-3-phosphate acyltransferase